MPILKLSGHFEYTAPAAWPGRAKIGGVRAHHRPGGGGGDRRRGHLRSSRPLVAVPYGRIGLTDRGPEVELAYRLRRFREWRFLSKADLARLAGISVTSLFAWERGDRLPTRHTLEKLAWALQIDVEDLLGEVT